MSARTPDADQADLGRLDSCFVVPDELPWRRTRYPGIEIKVLVEDRETGLWTALLRWAPGAQLPLHEHVDIEQTYVLEGSFEDHEGVCRAGEFVWRPAGSRHEAWSQEGALILAMLLKPNRFLEEMGRM